MNRYIGIDLGGTNVRVVITDGDYNIIREKTSSVMIEKGIDAVKQNIISMVREVKGDDAVAAIGIGAPGPVDEVTKTMLMATNLPGFEGYPLAKYLEEEFNIPTFIGNDANVAGLAEAIVGGGKGKPIVQYVTISTGIGAALIIDGKVINGNRGFTGEVGNIVVRRENGIAFGGLNPGAVESESSGTAITKKGKTLFGDKIEHVGNIVDLAKEGNQQAINLLDESIEDLGIMLAALAQAIAPNVIVLGGGVMKSSDYILPKLKDKFNQYIHANFRGYIDLELAQLEQCGAIGAAMLGASFVKETGSLVK